MRQQQLGLSSGSARGRRNPFQRDREPSRTGTQRCPPGCSLPGSGGSSRGQKAAAAFPQFNPTNLRPRGAQCFAPRAAHGGDFPAVQVPVPWGTPARGARPGPRRHWDKRSSRRGLPKQNRCCPANCSNPSVLGNLKETHTSGQVCFKGRGCLHRSEQGPGPCARCFSGEAA